MLTHKLSDANKHLQTFAQAHTHTHTHGHNHFDGHRLDVTPVTSTARAAIQKAPSSNQICVSVCVCVLFLSPLHQLPLGWFCFTGHYIVWHMGFAPSLCPGNKAKQAASEWKPSVWCRFHHVQLSLMSPEWNWGTDGPLLTGSPAPVLGHFVVCQLSRSASGSTSGRAVCFHESMWQTHFLWIAHLHALSQLVSINLTWARPLCILFNNLLIMAHKQYNKSYLW